MKKTTDAERFEREAGYAISWVLVVLLLLAAMALALLGV